jgi:hypothetical protein
VVLRTYRRKLHPDSLSFFRPSYDSFHTDGGQPRRLTKDQMQLGADGEHSPRMEAEPGAAQVLNVPDIVSRSCRQGDGQRCDEPRGTLYGRHSFRTSSRSGTSSRPNIIPLTLRIRRTGVLLTPGVCIKTRPRSPLSGRQAPLKCRLCTAPSGRIDGTVELFSNSFYPIR